MLPQALVAVTRWHLLTLLLSSVMPSAQHGLQ